MIYKEPYILSQYCSQIFFILDVLDKKWWFLISYDPRGENIMHPIDEDDLINKDDS